MKPHTALLAAALASVCTPAAADPDRARWREDRLVGMWSTVAEVKRCGSTAPPATARNTIVFHTGGTLTEIARFAPNGVPNVYNVPGQNQRTYGLGTWAFIPRTQEYLVSLRFDWFVDGVYHGYQTVERSIRLGNGADQGSGPVTTTRYGLDGSVIAELCGTAVSARLH